MIEQPRKFRGPHPMDDFPERDDVADAIFDRMMADEMKADQDGFGFTFARALNLLLPLRDPAKPAPGKANPNAPKPAPGALEGNTGGAVGVAEPRHPGANPRRSGPTARPRTDQDSIGGGDPEAEHFYIYYVEENCPEHGFEAHIVVQVNGEAIHFDAAMLPQVLSFLGAKYIQSQRTE